VGLHTSQAGQVGQVTLAGALGQVGQVGHEGMANAVDGCSSHGTGSQAGTGAVDCTAGRCGTGRHAGTGVCAASILVVKEVLKAPAMKNTKLTISPFILGASFAETMFAGLVQSEWTGSWLDQNNRAYTEVCGRYLALPKIAVQNCYPVSKLKFSTAIRRST